LLKSRILFDAGLYKKSMAELEPLTSKVLSNKYEKTELIYRLARNYHLLDEKEKAIKKYKETVESSKDLKAYFNASAAYHLARIYEKEKMYNDSKKYYKLCLKFKNHSYKRSFDIKAKSGLHRINQIDNSF
jgi:tetratricopeptide (TPR) repeat protein